MTLSLKDLCRLVNACDIEETTKYEKEIAEIAVSHPIVGYQEMALLALAMLPNLSAESRVTIETVCNDRKRDWRVIETAREIRFERLLNCDTDSAASDHTT